MVLRLVKNALTMRSYKKLAAEGDLDGLFVVGLCYEEGEIVKKNCVEAVKWYKLAAERGYLTAQMTLAIIYEYGQRGIQQDHVEAIKWYTLAAEQGDLNATFALGSIYENQQNHVEAVKWYTLAAEKGDATAQFGLAYLYYEYGQRGIQQDHVETIKWYTLAAEQGNATAQLRLASMYEEGRGIQQDHVEAVKWYTLAAEQGNATAQSRLASMYEERQNNIEAKSMVDQSSINAQSNYSSKHKEEKSFTGFFKKALKTTGAIAAVTATVAGIAAYEFGKYILDNGKSTVNRGFLTALARYELTAEEQKILRKAKLLQDKVDYSKNKNNELNAKLESLEKQKFTLEYIDNKKNEILDIDDNEQKKLIFSAIDEKQKSLVESLPQSIDELSYGIEVIQSEISTNLDRYNSDSAELDEYMEQIKEILAIKKEEIKSQRNN